MGVRAGKKKSVKTAGRVVETFLFSDIVKSTEIRNRLTRESGAHQGNERYRKEILDPHDERVERLAKAQEGKVFGTAGDSYFLEFVDARQAVEFAAALQRSLTSDPIPVPVKGLPEHVEVRIGLHTGPVTPVIRGGQPNYDDETVSVAHRIQERAEGERILTSQETWRQAGEIPGLRKREWAGYRLKGLREPWTLVEVLYDERPPLRPKGSDRASDSRLLLRYLREVRGDSVTLKLTTVDRKTRTGSREATELDLAAIFTDLDVQEAADDAKTRSGGQALDRAMARAERGRLAVIAAVSRHDRLVLLGDPGSGKSTLVNFLALCLAGERLGDKQANLRRLGKAWRLGRLVPIRIILRDYAARGLPSGKGLWQFFRDELAAVKSGDEDLSGCLPAVEDALGKPGGAILFLDGVDEVPQANSRRVDLRRAIESFARDFPRCRILVTSRPYGYQDSEARLPEFEMRTLLDFTPEQTEAFIGRWYAHVGAKDRALGRASAERYAGQLRRVVTTHPRIAELARRPLLLTLMASLHRWSEGGTLPEKRQELYEQSVQLLIDLWQREKNLFDEDGKPIGTKEYDVFTELGIRQEKLREALNCVAFEAHRDQPALTGTHDVTAGRLAGGLYEASEDKGKARGEHRIIHYITDRAGLLIERVQGSVYTFPHRTFQEYLAACHLAGPNFPYDLKGLLRGDDERWREVALLAAAKAASGSPAPIWTLLNEFCPHDWPPPGAASAGDWRLAIRAAQALIETGNEARMPERQQPLATRLKTRLFQALTCTELPSRERADAGSLLNRLPGGDPRPEVTGFPDSVWVQIPKGSCWIGSTAKETDDDEKLQAYVRFPAFRIMRFPVTHAQYAAFAKEKGYPAPTSEYSSEYSWSDGHPPRGKENHPVVLVSFGDAMAFCEWLSGKLGVEVRLPTEGEWEYAAKGPQGKEERERDYPWGGPFDPEKCNTSESGIGGTSPVGIFPDGARPDGPEEMAGNVWEWTASAYRKYPYSLTDDDGWEKRRKNTDSGRSVRGGSWNDPQDGARCAFRFVSHPDVRDVILGFRCCSGSPG